MSNIKSLGEFIDVQILISMRKADYYLHMWNEMGQCVESDLRENVKKAFVETIATMDNYLFLSDEEKRENKIRTNLSFSLDRKNIRNKFLENLSIVDKRIYEYIRKL